MKINLTKKQFRTLLKMLYMAEWMVNAHRTGSEDDPFEKGYQDLEQYFYSLAEDFGCNDLVMYDKKLGKYYPQVSLEEDSTVRGLIAEYDNNSFWEELFYRLVERDMIKKYGLKTYFNITWQEKIEKEELIREKWDREFEKYGIERMGIYQKKALKKD